MVRRGFHDATSDPVQIHEWWTRWPDANVAIATGGGLVVLDVDPAKGGLKSLEVLLAGADSWHTPTVLTGGGGLHFYFSTWRPIRNAQRFRGLAGIDVRGEGGYVVAPPSAHVAGRYRWRDGLDLSVPMAAWPFDEDVGEHSTALGVPETVVEGQRNDTLFRLAAHMRRAGFTSESIEAALLLENASRCVPALPESEVAGIVRSVARYEATGTPSTSVDARLGVLASGTWTPLPLAALGHRRLGITPAEFDVLLVVLARRFSAENWPSFSQAMLARDLDVDRRTIGAQIQSLRRKGLLAVHPDKRYGFRSSAPAHQPTLHYSADPYLVALKFDAARDSVLHDVLLQSALEQLEHFARDVSQGRWTWWVGEARSDHGVPTTDLVRRFLVRYSGEEVLKRSA